MLGSDSNTPPLRANYLLKRKEKICIFVINLEIRKKYNLAPQTTTHSPYGLPNY
jgi:hypothetical protein